MKTSTVLEVTLKSGSKVVEHHMNEEAAQASIRQMQYNGLEIELVSVQRRADLGVKETGVKCAETAYGEIK